MDPVLEDTYVASEVLKCIHIGLLCVQEDAADRPTMSLVVVMLASDTMTLTNPKNPAFSVGRMTKEDSSTSKNSRDPSINEVTVTRIVPR
ncbi:cysteine-rich receptor-like protein kinase 10 isoform X2 [Senna tora]|uniref:Cysteine-rich receptor-like protein kinase 10 isoform X2 n=1 Tax=Senna tora TaxID=362788 RepID=A0A834X268_9FABA|nr:cysteine-rich receptor-like protein kinase 10 isoform X2 [Senna tora]